MTRLRLGSVELLVEETLREFNIDISELDIQSHQKILAKCLNCGETISREFRHIGQQHHCATHIIRNDGIKLKWCNVCKKYLTYKCFTKNAARFDGLNSLCKNCSNDRPTNQRSNTKKSKRRKTPLGWIKWAIMRKRTECRRNNTVCDIDSEYLLNQYNMQGGLCYYSKTGLEFGTGSLYSASLERLNPNNGYTKGNVVLASRAMNSAKNSASLAEFMQFLSDMSYNSTATYVRLETKIIDDNAKLPFRKRATDAGHDIASTEDVLIPPHSTVNISTGIIVCPPDGFYFTIEGRSSLAMKGIIPFRGTIDATYQGHLMVALTNISDNNYAVKKGDRIAQIVLHPIIHADFQLVEEFSPVNNGRATCGFGSTGR